jgi:xanthine dehydrogenase YagT iron-sulfur-binding subunit
MTDPTTDPRRGLSRRTFLKGAGGATAAGIVAREALAQGVGDSGPKRLSGSFELELRVNGAKQTVAVEPRTTLLSALRHKVEPALTGTKEVCAHGNCGACTVLLDGRPVYSCIVLAAHAAGREIRTVEGLGTASEPSAVQRAFCAHDASMCGFCTPGFVVSATAALEANPAADDAEIRRRLSGNLCRCGTYPHVFAAVKAAGDELRGGKR